MKFKTNTGNLLTKINLVSSRIFNRILRDHGITDINSGQGRILFALLKKDNIPIQELCKQTLLKKSTMTTAIDRMEKSGYIKRVPSNNDRRVINLILTEKNVPLKNNYTNLSENMTNIFFKGFSNNEIQLLESSLTKILTNLIEYETNKSE